MPKQIIVLRVIMFSNGMQICKDGNLTSVIASSLNSLGTSVSHTPSWYLIHPFSHQLKIQ